MADSVTPKAVSRRSFLKSSAALSATTAFSALGAPAIIQAQNMSDPVRFAFIGTGRQGNLHLRTLKNNALARCVMLCDIYPPNLKLATESIGNNPETEPNDYRRVLERKDVEAVMIASPYHLHVPMLVDALNAGKHVFCEKVMMKTEEEIPKVYEAANAHPNQILQVGLQRRYSMIYRVAMQMVHSGALGKVQFVRAQWHRNGSWRIPVPDPKFERLLNWRCYREYSGGLMAELGSHQVDVADWAFQAEPVSVVGVGGLDYWKDGRDIFDNVSVIFEYPEGQKFVFTSICNNAFLDFSEVIMGDEGTIEITLGANSATATFYPERKAPDAPTAKVKKADSKEQNWWAGATLSNRGKKKGVPILPEAPKQNPGFIEKEIEFARKWLLDMGVIEREKERNAIAAEHDGFFTSIREGKKPAANLDVAAADSRAVIYANQAMQLNQKVFWPSHAEVPSSVTQISKKS
ncbi:MAG: Gfo/Idh/MocA family oxidoreductase [Acidobacteriota bacterium]